MHLSRWSKVLITAATLADSEGISIRNITESVGSGFDLHGKQIAHARSSCATPIHSGQHVKIISNASSMSTGDIDPIVTEMSKREKPWQTYLSSLCSDSGEFNVEHIRIVRTLWRTLTSFLGLSTPLPIAQPTDDGALLLAWNNSNEYLDVEIFPNSKVSWFYRDRVSEKIDGSNEDLIDIGRIPTRFFGYLKRFKA